MPVPAPTVDRADVQLAHLLADAAGAIIRSLFRVGLPIDDKADASPVTRADRDAEAAMRAIVERHRPADGFIGEEHGTHQPHARRLWVVDPIDGTRAFIAGRPTFGTLIALLVDGEPVLGLIDQPIARDRWLGFDGIATLNGTVIGTRPCTALAHARLASTAPAAFPPADWGGFSRVALAAADVLWGGDCHNYGLLAAGWLDGVIESGLQLHDWAALVPVVTGAGGTMTDWTGAPLRQGSDGRVIALGDAALLPDVLARL